MKENIKKDTRIFIYFSVLFFFFGIMAVVWISKGTYSLKTENENRLDITCPMVSDIGEEIKCHVSANLYETKVLSINANFKIPEGIEFISFGTECNKEICLEPLVINEKGFALGNVNGITEGDIIGILTLRVSDKAIPGNNYNIILENIEFSDEYYVMHSIKDTNASVRLKIDAANLSEISLRAPDEKGEFTKLISLNKTFDENVLEYNATVDDNVKQIIASYIKPDNEFSTVNGNGVLGIPIDLHYGTNTLEFNVTSESGRITKNYKIFVKRMLDFNTKVYLHNKEKNYLYVANAKSEEIINNLEKLEDNLSYRITNENKLEIIYGNNEVVASVNIVSFSTEFNIVDNSIYIESGLTYANIIDKIKSDKLIIKVLDVEGNEISSGTGINETHKLALYYNEEQLGKTYKFKINGLKIDDSLIIDDEIKVIKRLPLGMTYNTLKGMFDTTGEISIVSQNETITDMFDIIKTGDKISVKLSNETITYTLSVLGDLTGDGKIKVTDVDKLYRGLKGRKELTDIEIAAGDIINDGGIKVTDVDKLYRYLKGKITSLEAVK